MMHTNTAKSLAKLCTTSEFYSLHYFLYVPKILFPLLANSSLHHDSSPETVVIVTITVILPHYGDFQEEGATFIIN